MNNKDDHFAWILQQAIANSYFPNSLGLNIFMEIGEMEQLKAIDLKAEMKQLEKQIDKTLENGDKEEFMRLSKRYKYLKAEGC